MGLTKLQKQNFHTLTNVSIKRCDSCLPLVLLGGGRVPARHVPISYSVFKILAMSIPFSNNLRKFRSKVAIIRFLFIHVLSISFYAIVSQTSIGETLFNFVWLIIFDAFCYYFNLAIAWWVNLVICWTTHQSIYQSSHLLTLSVIYHCILF